jgi:hypothetical protein
LATPPSTQRLRLTDRTASSLVSGATCRVYKPINIDYSSTPSTTNNRKWLTHQKDLGTAGTGSDGTLVYHVNNAATNTAVKSTFIETPLVRIGDTMVIQRSGTNRYARITGVDRAAKTVDHDAIAGSAAPGDTATRFFVANVDIEDPDGNIYNLKAGRDYTMLIDDTYNIRGFTLINDIEAAFAFSSSPFDPSTWKIRCNVYGRVGGDVYGNADPVSSVVTNGGVSGRTVTAIFHLLQDAYFDVLNELSTTEFQAVEDSSLSIGLVIPDSRETSEAPTYRDTLSRLLTSNLYKLALTEEDDTIKLGITELQPFQAGGDYSADELNHKGLEFTHDYANVVSDVQVSCLPHDVQFHTEALTKSFASAESPAAKNLHFISKLLQVDSLLADEDDAQTLADRLSYALGERRGYYTVDLELPYVNKANLGQSYDLIRQHMPGFSYADGTQHTRQLAIAEVTKNARTVTMTLEDQKGVQDNSANW